MPAGYEPDMIIEEDNGQGLDRPLLPPPPMEGVSDPTNPDAPWAQPLPNSPGPSVEQFLMEQMPPDLREKGLEMLRRGQGQLMMPQAPRMRDEQIDRPKYDDRPDTDYPMRIDRPPDTLRGIELRPEHIMRKPDPAEEMVKEMLQAPRMR